MSEAEISGKIAIQLRLDLKNRLLQKKKRKRKKINNFE